MSKDIKKWSYETEIKYLDSEKEQLKEQVDNLRQDLQNRSNRCIELNDENKELKQDKEAIHSIWKKTINRENNLIVEHKELKKRISKLVSENTKLQNDLFSEQLMQDETEEYINRLKQELFSEHLKQVETEDFIDKLKQELKEYRGF